MLQYDNVVVFDGTCNVCNWTVRFILKHDRNRVFRFCSLHSETGQNITTHHSNIPENEDTVMLLQNQDIFYKSDAVLKIMKHLGPVYKILARIGAMFPVIFLDRIYDFIARRRYRWFGRNDSCNLIEGDYMDRFMI